MKVLITGASYKIGITSAFSLSKEGFDIIGTDERRLPFNQYSRHLKSHYIHSPFSNEKFFDELVTIIKKEVPDVLLLMGGTKQVSLHKNEIKKYVGLLVPDYNSFCKVFDKNKTHDMCVETGILVPERFTYNEAKSRLNNSKDTKLVIKPDYDAGGALGLSFIHNNEELEKAAGSIQKNFGNYVIEEFIPGASNMRAVQLVFDKQNKIVASFILKKIRQWPISGGITAYAESTHEWELIEFILPFFERCPWEGPVEAELIIDERDGKPKLIEINPRFAGSIAFAVQAGVNFPVIVCKASTENNPYEINPCYDTGKFYMNSSYYFKAVLKEYKQAQNKSLFLNDVLRELRQKKFSAMPDKKDFPVYVAKALRELKRSKTKN